MPDLHRRRSVSQTRLSEILVAALDGWSVDHPGREVVDLGGGTGGMAIGLGERGYRVRVVDPSPDALAALGRRTAEVHLNDSVSGLQGDATDLVEVVGATSTDLVVCHKVLEVVDDPGQALAAIRTVLRPCGALSLVVTQRHAAVLTQAIGGPKAAGHHPQGAPGAFCSGAGPPLVGGGHIAQAHRTWAAPGMFDRGQVLTLVRRAGFEVVATHGVGAIADHVAESVLDSEAGAHAELLALEAEVATDAAFQALAPLLHVFATRTS